MAFYSCKFEKNDRNRQNADPYNINRNSFFCTNLSLTLPPKIIFLVFAKKNKTLKDLKSLFHFLTKKNEQIFFYNPFISMASHCLSTALNVDVIVFFFQK